MSAARRAARSRTVRAAGAVVWRATDDGGSEVCLVHRPKYDDWSLPKGKIDPNEHALTCAAREVAEETGHDVVLGRPLPVQQYDVAGGRKHVRYWLAEADPDPAQRRPDAEVDDVVFLPVADALERLTHRHDADLVSTAMDGPLRTACLVLLRHTEAVDRSAWDGPDARRPLDARGKADAQRLVAPLATLGLRRLVSSDTVRCIDAVRPFAERQHLTLEPEPLLSEESLATAGRPHPATKIARSLLADGAALVCSHRPVLPLLFEAVGVDPAPSPAPGSFSVVHQHDGRLVAADHHTL